MEIPLFKMVRMGVIHSWDYDSPFVRERMDKSLAIIQAAVPADFAGVFVEIGAHNGQFTDMLLAAFPAASIAACDIKGEAWDKHGPFPEAVTFQQCDMASFTLPERHKDKPVVLLMLECLYYNPPRKRDAVMRQILDQLPNLERVFVSGPVGNGRRYFKEEALRKLFEDNGLHFQRADVLNETEAFRTKFAWDAEWGIRLLLSSKWFLRRYFDRLIGKRIAYLNRRQAEIRTAMRSDQRMRRKYAHQVMFQFLRQHQ